MELEKCINDDMKAAMLARNQEKLEAIRAVKAAILLEKTKEGGTGEIDEDIGIRILQRLVKQRRESAEIYMTGNREDLAKKELFEASVIEQYLPQQMEPEKVREIIVKIISETGASSVKEMGKVMGIASKELAGKADNKVIATIIKELLTH